MPIDHSLTYKEFKLKNIPHKIRLNKILKIIASENRKFENLLDVGCSNGYLTDIIKNHFEIPLVKGVDYDLDNIKLADERYPSISFSEMNLNIPTNETRKFELVTCLETLEHVGDINQALDNLLTLKAKGGCLFISVPIEIGFWGITKFLFKRYLYNYSLEELSNTTSLKYLLALLGSKNISAFRSNKKQSFGTHFGFDYRLIENFLTVKRVPFQAFNSFTTRFFLIT